MIPKIIIKTTWDAKFLLMLVILLLLLFLGVIWKLDTTFFNSAQDTISTKSPTSMPLPSVQEKNLPDIVSEWSPYVVLVTCWWNNVNVQTSNRYYQRGSSIIRYNYDTQQIDILTNRHVLSHKIGNPGECLFSTDPNHNYATNAMDFYPAANNIDAEIVAFSKNKKPAAHYKEYDEENFSYFEQIAKSSPLIDPNKFCRNVSIGDKIVILGYPYTGGDFGTNITATEGIISGFDGSFYVTSAKIEQGNSGGIAVSVKDNCYLGIPSNVATGHFESLGRILRWEAFSFKR